MSCGVQEFHFLDLIFELLDIADFLVEIGFEFLQDGVFGGGCPHGGDLGVNFLFEALIKVSGWLKLAVGIADFDVLEIFHELVFHLLFEGVHGGCDWGLVWDG